MIEILTAAVACLAMTGLGVLAVLVRRRNMHLWLRSYWFGSPVVNVDRRQATSAGPVAVSRRLWGKEPKRCEAGEGTSDDDRPLHVFIAVCDHFEPEWGRPGRATALERVRRWQTEYPRLFSEFRDNRGQVPQHTFFFPQDEYRPEYLDLLADLCEQGFGDVDVHLHHDGDTADTLRAKLGEFRDTLFHRHSLLRRDARTGHITYGFIHGNWALCNSRPDGRWCGVNAEIPVLRETGCYADFTLPSAPDVTQTRTVNSIYYATDRPGQPKSHDAGIRAEAGRPPVDDGLLMIQGPLALDWTHRKWGLLPRLENGSLHGSRPPSWERFRLWLQAGVHVRGRPDWRFVKLHTHGAKDGNIEMWLGEPMRRFHAELARQAGENRQLRFYYVTAWEMAQLVHQAERGAEQPSFPVGDRKATASEQTDAPVANIAEGYGIST